MIKCYGCLAEFQKTTDDPVPVPHLYIGAITECWNVFGEVLMKEYSNPEYFKVHRLTVDAYGAQHIGNQEDRRARQSANIHLIALYLTLVQKASEEEVLKFLRKATNVKKDWPSLFQRKQAYWLTIQDIAKEDNPLSHADLVIKWGQSIWEAYEDCHQEIISYFTPYNRAKNLL